MKNVSTIMAVSEKHAKTAICRMSDIQAKKLLFVLSTVKAGERLDQCDVREARQIAELFDGIIDANYAKCLADMLAKEFERAYPGVLMTSKRAKEYTNACYSKLYDALGLRGFDYVLTVLRAGKAFVANPENGIDEGRMLQAMRWEERREDRDVALANAFYHRKGLELVGFGDMADRLKEYSFIIANVYELLTPGQVEVKKEPDGVREMKIHFIEAAVILEDFYLAEEPVVPEGYSAAQLAEGSMLFDLAVKGQLKDSEAILEYYQAKRLWDAAVKVLEKEFSEEECEVIYNNPEAVKALIKNEW